MITKEEFITIIEVLQDTDKYIEDLADLGIDLFDTPIMDNFYKLENLLFKSNFEEYVIDTIYWWLYELEDKTVPVMWDKDENVIPMETVEDLWNFCKDYLK